jgi:hypothetical protein
MALMNQLHSGEYEVHQLGIFLQNNNQGNPTVTILFVTFYQRNFPPTPVNVIDQLLFYFLPAIYKHTKWILILSAQSVQHKRWTFIFRIPSEITQT